MRICLRLVLLLLKRKLNVEVALTSFIFVTERRPKQEKIFTHFRNKIYILINTFAFCKMSSNNERIFFFFWGFSSEKMSLVLKIVSKKLLRFVFIEKVFTILKTLYSFSSFYTHLRKLRRIEIGRLIYVVYLWIQETLSIAHIISLK